MRRGLVCYDGECPLCRRLVSRFGPALRRSGFQFVTLQMPSIQRRLGIYDVPDEMKLILPNGKILGGVDAVIALTEALGLDQDLANSARSIVMRPLLDLLYKLIAKHRGCAANACQIRRMSA